MKVKKILIRSLVLLLNIFMLNPSLAHAETLDGEVITIDNTMSLVEQKEAVDEFQNNPYITELIVLDETLLEDEVLVNEENMYQTRAIVNKYRVTGVSNGPDSTGGAIATTSGGPGINLAISQTKSIATSISASFGASAEVLTAGIGWNTTGSTSISISGSYKVPSTVGSKRVKTCTLKAHTVYKTKKYNVQKMAWNSTKWKTSGSGVAKKAYGVSFKKSFTYK